MPRNKPEISITGEEQQLLSLSENLGVENPLAFVKYMLQTMVRSIHLLLTTSHRNTVYHCFLGRKCISCTSELSKFRRGCSQGRVKIGLFFNQDIQPVKFPA